MALESLAVITHPFERIIAAQDQDTWREARKDLKAFADVIGLAKYNSIADEIGVPTVIKRTASLGVLTMMDLKIHDIDDTNFRRVRAQTLNGASIITVHAGNTLKALQKATRGREEALKMNPNLKRPWILGVTVLTSITDDEKAVETCTSIYGEPRSPKVRQFGHLAADAGFDGFVCSPWEAEMLKNDPITAHMNAVLPAIRPLYAVENDEQRATATTPKIAQEAGGDLFVVGRPLIKARNYGLTPREAALAIAGELT